MASLISDSNEMSEDDAREWIDNLKTEISDLDNTVCQLAVSRDGEILKEVSEHIQNALVLKSPICDPSDYQITISCKGTKAKYWNIEISGKTDEAFNHSNLLQLQIESKSLTENCSIQNLINRGKAIIACTNKEIYPVKAKINEELIVRVQVIGKT